MSMTEQEKITIIEGPPPTFELAGDAWLQGLAEGPVPSSIAFCKLRTFNGPELVERCYRAWQQGENITLEFRTESGLTQEAPIVASRWAAVDDGHILMLWVRLEDDFIEVELDLDDFDDDIDLDDFDDLDFEDL